MSTEPTTRANLERMRMSPLLRRLLARGWEFDFLQAAWLLERFVGAGEPVGGRGPVSAESLRFRPHVSMGFPASDVRRIQTCADGAPDHPYFLMDVTFLGLYGVSTPLPLHYSTEVLRQVHRDAARVEEETPEATAPTAAAIKAKEASEPLGRSSTRDFLDLFHHRLASLFYRAGLKYRYEFAYGTPGRDALTGYLQWLIGYPARYDEQTLGVPPQRLLRYAGILTRRPRGAAELEGALSDYFGRLTVRVSQCTGRWITLGDADRNVFGQRNSRLGVDLTVGGEVYDLNGSLAIRVGPVDWATYATFIPDQPRALETRALVERFCCDPLLFTLEVTIRGAEVPETVLGGGEGAGRLGYTCWVRSQEMPDTTVSFASEGIGRRHRAA